MCDCAEAQVRSQVREHDRVATSEVRRLKQLEDENKKLKTSEPDQFWRSL